MPGTIGGPRPEELPKRSSNQQNAWVKENQNLVCSKHLKIWNNTVSELFNILFYWSALIFNKFYFLLVVVHAVATRRINNNIIILIIPAGLCRVLINGSDGGDMEQLLPLKVISLPQHIPFQEEGACHTSKSTPRSSMCFSGQKAVKGKTNSHPRLSFVWKRQGREGILVWLVWIILWGLEQALVVRCLVLCHMLMWEKGSHCAWDFGKTCWDCGL